MFEAQGRIRRLPLRPTPTAALAFGALMIGHCGLTPAETIAAFAGPGDAQAEVVALLRRRFNVLTLGD